MKQNKIDDISTESINNDIPSNEGNTTSISENITQNSYSEKEVKLEPDEITLNDKKIDDIFKEIKNNPNIEVYGTFEIKRFKNIIALVDDNNKFEEHFLFKKELLVNYKNVLVSDKNITLVDKSVKSTIQIQKVMTNYKIKSLIYETAKHRKFPTSKNILYELVESDNFNINFLCVMEDLIYIHDPVCINNIPQIIDLNSLSIYSNKYFEYSENKIDYIETKERKKFLFFLNDFIFLEDANFFKITGPSNDGKTLTLLLFSRRRKNIIYFNLKYIMKLFYSNDVTYLKLMMYELGRAYISTTEEINKVENIFKDNTLKHPWKIILELAEIFKNESKIIILDQFKEKTIDFTIFEKIEKGFEGKALKFIICSSINDFFIKKNVLDTIKDFHGNPEYLNKECQRYYFYFCNLLSKEKLKEYYEKKNIKIKYIDSFSYNPKYVHMFTHSQDELVTLNSIKTHVIKKVEESYKERDVSYKEILFLISSNIGKELDYVKDFKFLIYTPLKFFTLEFDKTFFKINYYYKYIKELIDEIKKDQDVDDYFQKGKAKNSNFYQLLQPYYFEESCINSMKKGNILPSEQSYQIYVKTISNLEQDQNYSSLDVNLYQKSETEISLKEYYDTNIKVIEQFIKDKNLEEQKKNNDIDFQLYQALITKKDEFKGFLKKKRYRNIEDGVVEDIDIEKKKVRIYEYKDSFNNGGIIINQIKKVGRTLDFGFLYGEKSSKIFLGFQIKCYAKDVKMSDDKKKNLNKQHIKETLRILLAQALIVYKINIQEWHYFIISLYNPDTGEYNQDIINICEKEGLEYLFYNPKTHIFYDKGFNKIEGAISLTFNSNLDYNKNNTPELIFENFHNIKSNFYEYCSITSLKKMLQQKATEFINIVGKGETLIQLNRKIKDKLEGIHNLNLISIYNYSENYSLPIPNETYLFLFINNTCDDYVYYYKKNNNFYCGLVLAEENNTIKPLFLLNFINTNQLKFLVYKFE